MQVKLNLIDSCFWFLEKNHKQESMPRNADPVLWSNEIKKKADTLDAYVSYITNFIYYSLIL